MLDIRIFRSHTVLFTSLLLLLTILASTPVGISAADSRTEVLINGNPPLTRGMVSDVAAFFEWLFERRMSTEQRDHLQDMLVRSWQQGERETINDIKEMVELYGKVNTLADERRYQVQEAVLPVMLKNLAAEPDKEISRLMLAVRGVEGGNSRTGQSPASGASGGDASQLLGAWQDTEISALQYQDRTTGSTTPGNGTSMAYKFYPDGRYEYTGYIQTTMYNCTTTAYNTVKGTYQFEGNHLVLNLEKNDWQMRSPCYPSKNMDRPGKMEAQTYTFRTKIENGMPRLCLTSVERGSENCFRKE